MNAKQILAGLTGCALLISAVGCMNEAKTDYGANSPATVTPTADPKTMTIPRGAQTLSEAEYSQVLFKVPAQPGSLYVYDVDTKTVCARTNVVAEDAGKPMTMGDLRNVTQGLDTHHTYRILFVPMAATTAP